MSETPARYDARPESVPVMQCPVAGFQYYEGESCWSRLRPNDRLVLRREPGNRHDPRAIAIEWLGHMLGYVPAEANYMLSQMMDRGCRVDARLASLRNTSDPWNRAMIEVAWRPAEGGIGGTPANRADSPFDPSEILLRSLGNRIFGDEPPDYAREWLRARAAALALVGVEKPAMLPFLRFVPGKLEAAASIDPVRALHGILEAAGIETAAWKRLPRFGFPAFCHLGARWLKPIPIARLANLLLRLDLQAPPPPAFPSAALTLALYRLPDPSAVLDFERYPLWFMRALVRALDRPFTSTQESVMRDEALRAADWILDAKPAPDANQMHAGWPWIVTQSCGHKKAAELARASPWSVPCGEMIFGRWRVVPLRTPMDLLQEAAAMKNCLDDYEGDCRTGNLAVYSIRDELTGERRACFSVARERVGEPWELEQLEGKKHAEVGQEMLAVALRAISVMR